MGGPVSTPGLSTIENAGARRLDSHHRRLIRSHGNAAAPSKTTKRVPNTRSMMTTLAPWKPRTLMHTCNLKGQCQHIATRHSEVEQQAHKRITVRSQLWCSV